MRITTRSISFVVAVFLLAAIALQAGCNIIGPLGYFVHGPPKISALIQLDPNRPTVVFIDDRESHVSHRSLRRRIARAVETELLENNAVVDLISSDAVLASTAQDRFGTPRSIASVGRDIGAEVIVYATVDSFGLSPDGVTYEPTGSVRLKVVDAVEGTRLWPVEPQQWHTVSATFERVRGEMPKNIGGRMEVLGTLADRLGESIGLVFVDHRAKETDSEVGR